MTTTTDNQTLNEMHTTSSPHSSIFMENESELWRKVWNFYLIVAQRPMVHPDKRQAWIQLAEDAKEQYTKTIEQAQVQPKKSLPIVSKASKSNSISFTTIIGCILAIIMIIILTTGIFSATIVAKLGAVSSAFRDEHPYAYMRIQHTTLSATVNRETIIHGTATPPFETTSILPEDRSVRTSLYEPIVMAMMKVSAYQCLKQSVFSIVIICLLFFTFCFVRSYVFDRPPMLICICSILSSLYRFIRSDSRQIHSPLLPYTIEKLILLDPTKQHPHLHSLFDNSLSIYSSIYDCVHHLTANHRQHHVLFLPLTTFEVHSFELARLSNVSLCLFYDHADSDLDNQAHHHLCKVKYHIRFIFPQACLFDHLRHAVILNHMKQAHMYRLEGLESRADEHYFEAAHQCRLLAVDLEQQSSTMNGRESVDAVEADDDDVSNSYLRSFTYVAEP